MIVGALLLLAASYGDHLLQTTLAHHRALRSIAIEVPGVMPLSRGKPVGTRETVALNNSMGEPIGELELTCLKRHCNAAALALEMSRRIYVANNLVEPDPFVPGAVASPFAARLVERALRANPDLVTLALHVAPPGQGNIIIASSFGRIGKPGDADDARIIATGIPAREVTNGGRRLAVELPLLDRRRRVIGALSTSFMLGPNVNAGQAFARAIAVRNAMAPRIASLEILAAGAR